MRILIQGLGEVPIPVVLAIQKLKPDIAYILCSEYQLNHVHPKFGKKNRDMVVEAARKTQTKVVFKRCDVFDPKSIRNCLMNLLRPIDIFKNEVIFNYTSGSAPVRLFLGILGVYLSKYSPKCKVVYSIKYEEQKFEMVENHREALREFLPSDIDLILELCLRKVKT